MVQKSNFKKEDTVLVIAGKETGKTGKVLRVLPERDRILIERINMIKRHQKPAGAQSPGGIIEKEASLHISNVMLVCPACNKPTRVGRRQLESGVRVRVCHKCNEAIDKA